ncbi:MAG: ribonuclease Y [Candidatus Komeilibacteria bacterium CG_4_10_14_0_2_um_filter_37_10]|uniref:Ribonuclease Y n=1 Tax=Candidatus Komeilibacteria bacterium CG_4_10_14_0_2_um_filter_37_10 TaxID=1974470 RepID=A0A2M7VGI5_9BACT|nr:MAG: ribonuclease Y [Candidatus Komeilibacteria bacterium CG_4_10_14_0_2_um_filter_37_10]
MSTIFWIVALVIVASASTLIGFLLRKYLGLRSVDSAERRADDILTEAKTKQKQILLEANEKSILVMEQAKGEVSDLRKDLQHQQKRLEQRETLFDQKLLDLENRQQSLYDKAKRVEALKKEIEDVKSQQLQKLEKIATFSQNEARDILLKNVEEKMQNDLLGRIRKLQDENNEEVEKQAKEILSVAIQRVSHSHAAETTTTVINLPSDEMKGRIIGREGRNIKTIEQLTGVEIIIDDTPEAILVSGFNPIRRHLAKRTLEKLIADGRIHPGRIEATIEEAKKELALDIKKAGEDTLYELGVTGIDPKLVMLLGRLKYRTSYGQNQLLHSVEVAKLSTILAEELGANVAVCKKGGIFHDIGKAVDQEVQGGHPEIGFDILKKFGLPEEVAYLCIAHHEDAPKTLEGVICKVADAISGARPGSRKDSFEHYIQRLDELEAVANSFAGVDKTYAIQAGREIRVFVKPLEIDDYKATILARDIADKIEKELKYPGEIKVNLIRETRIIEYAR